MTPKRQEEADQVKVIVGLLIRVQAKQFKEKLSNLIQKIQQEDLSLCED